MESSLPPTYIENFHNEELCRLMEYRTLGKTGLQVSKIGMGCATFSNLYGDFDVEEAIQTIIEATKAGINYFDTAPFYGQGRSEEVLGMAFKQIPRKAYYVATKVGRYEQNFYDMFDFSPAKARASVEKSLKLLDLDYVDVIQIHDFEYAKSLDVIIDELLPELEKLVKEGKARYIGVTGYQLNLMKQCIDRAPGRFDLILNYARYTLLDNALESYIDFFHQQNLGIVCAAAHAQGLLTNGGPPDWQASSGQIKKLCRKAANICKEANVELGKLAMYHCLQLKGASTFVVGMQTRGILELNLNAYYNGLTARERQIYAQLCASIFTKTYNWEGVELEEYWTAVKNKNN